MLVIVGPTCSGKTALAVACAQALAPAEIINADSRQVRRGLRVGTCAPRPSELHGVRCHLLDLCDPGETFTVADWLMAARRSLERLDRSGRRAVVAGLADRAADQPDGGAIRAHRDGAIFLSFFKGPKSVVCAAGLLTEIGDNRAGAAVATSSSASSKPAAPAIARAVVR